MQFTKTAGIAAIAGTILIFFGCMNHHGRWKVILLGMSLLLIGSWYRFSSCLLVLLIMSTLGLAEVIKSIKRYGISRGIFHLKLYFFTFGIALFLIYSTRILDNQIYESDEEWASYREYNSNRSNLLDYGFPDYNEFQQEYEKLGISQNDVVTFSSWIFADPEIFTNELMEKLIALKTKKEITVDFVFEFFRLFPYSFFKENLFLISLFLFVIWIIEDKKERYMAFYLFILVLGVYFYLFYQGRYLQHRVDVVIWMSVLCLLAFLINNITILNRSEYKKSFLVFTLLISLFHIQPYWTNILEKPNLIEEKTHQKEMCKLIGNDKDRLYYVLATDDRMSTCYLPLDIRRMGTFSNIYALGGWGTQMPIMNRVLTDYGVYNPFHEMVNNPDMYLVSPGYPELVVTYICEHYDSNAYACLVKSYEGFDFYKIISGNTNINIEKALVFNDMISSDYYSYWDPNTKMLTIAGNIYKKESNSFEEELLLKVQDKISEDFSYYYITQYMNYNNSDLYHGLYSEFYYEIYIEDPDKVDIELILNTDKTFYKETVKYQYAD